MIIAICVRESQGFCAYYSFYLGVCFFCKRLVYGGVLIKNSVLIKNLNILCGSMSVRAFAKKCSINEATMLKYFNGSVPSVNAAYSIARACGVTVDWLVAGDDDCSRAVLNKVSESVVICDADHIDVSSPFVEKNIISRISFDSNFEKMIGMEISDSVGLLVRGYDMEPDLDYGDVILIDTSIANVDRDGIYAFTYKGNHFVKQLQRIGDRIRVSSSNCAKYEAWHIDDKKSLDIFGLVKVNIKIL